MRTLCHGMKHYCPGPLMGEYTAPSPPSGQAGERSEFLAARGHLLCATLTVLALWLYVRFRRGQTQDQRFAGLGQLAADLFQLAAARRP